MVHLVYLGLDIINLLAKFIPLHFISGRFPCLFQSSQLIVEVIERTLSSLELVGRAFHYLLLLHHYLVKFILSLFELVRTDFGLIHCLLEVFYVFLEFTEVGDCLLCVYPDYFNIRFFCHIAYFLFSIFIGVRRGIKKGLKGYPISPS